MLFRLSGNHGKILMLKENFAIDESEGWLYIFFISLLAHSSTGIDLNTGISGACGDKCAPLPMNNHKVYQ
jgi:hypothetical protein